MTSNPERTTTTFPRVEVTRNPRQTMPYTVSTAAPFEPLTEIARFKAGGDANAYELTVRDRIAKTAGQPVRFIATP